MPEKSENSSEDNAITVFANHDKVYLQTKYKKMQEKQSGGKIL